MAARPSMFFPPSASSTLGGDAASTKNSDPSASSASSTPKLENPLLGRSQQHQFAMTSTTTTALRDASNDGAGSGGGLRQRHRTPTTAAAASAPSWPRRNIRHAPTPPPRTSYSLGTESTEWNSNNKNSNRGPSNVDVATAKHLHQPPPQQDATTSTNTSSRALVEDVLQPSTRNCWVLIWGYTTQPQMERMVQFFSSFGNVLDSRGCSSFQPGCSNWFALQYENDLLARKAIAHSGTTPLNQPGMMASSSSSIYCGVKLLNDDDPIVTHKNNWTTTSSSNISSPLWKQRGATDSDHPHANAAADALPDKESILLSGPGSSSSRLADVRKQRSLCEQFLRYILLIRD